MTLWIFSSLRLQKKRRWCISYFSHIRDISPPTCRFSPTFFHNKKSNNHFFCKLIHSIVFIGSEFSLCYNRNPRKWYDAAAPSIAYPRCFTHSLSSSPSAGLKWALWAHCWRRSTRRYAFPRLNPQSFTNKNWEQELSVRIKPSPPPPLGGWTRRNYQLPVCLICQSASQ